MASSTPSSATSARTDDAQSVPAKRDAKAAVFSAARPAPVSGAAKVAQGSPKRLTNYELSTNLRIAVARLTRRIRTEKTGGDLSDGQYSVLALVHREGPKTLSELSRHERVTPPSMNRTVNHLEAAGYVVRRAAPDDKRKVLFVPTDSGRELVNETRRRRDAWLDRRLAKLPPESRALLAEAAAVIRELADS
ncbi:MarR family transcriptional regulator [Planctomonas sp. JC2975]|uniref:MarR family winged helix-turn-helix transcriptional regulator n=1 Tax=Planctomonas sp. JC2975 TaxID=2729626 RepID=UPI001475EE6D|nr:MarR family transcriptional regulator [Planctomonas sp. JC2975]NNC12795.1 MarR family transcriptional regulator [Planctomonas sp. JC2975]